MDSREPENGAGEILTGLSADHRWPSAPHRRSAPPALDIGFLARAVDRSRLSWLELSMLAVDPGTKRRLSPAWLAELAAGRLAAAPEGWQIRALASAIGNLVDDCPAQSTHGVAQFRLCADEWLFVSLPSGVSGEDRRRLRRRAARFVREGSAATGDAGTMQCEVLRASLHELDPLLGPVMLHREPGKLTFYCAAGQIDEDLPQVVGTMGAKLSQATMRLDPAAKVSHTMRLIRVAPDVMPEPLHPAVGMVAPGAAATILRADLLTAGLAAAVQDVCAASWAARIREQAGFLSPLPAGTRGRGGNRSRSR